MNESILLLITTTLTLATLTACASPSPSSTSTVNTDSSSAVTSSSYDLIEDINTSLDDSEVIRKSTKLNGVSVESQIADLKQLQSQPEMVQQAYKELQINSDIIRLQHLKHWVTLIEEYQKKTGKYPFQGESTNPVYVEVANPAQQEYINQHPPAPAITKSMKTFVQTLESGLGREINELYDPQYAPDAKPPFYIYMINGATYNFAIHTHQKYLFGKRIAPNYNKVEVSNVYNNSVNLVVTSEVLFNSDPYQAEANKVIQKPEFFEQRKQKMLHATKEK